MNKLNIPSYGTLISREHQIKALQDLYSYVSNLSGNLKDNEVEINAVDNNHIVLQNGVYTKITGLTELTSNTIVNINLADTVSGTQNIYEGSFNIGDDITTDGKKLTIKWPTSINWGTSDISIVPNSHYEFSIKQDDSSFYGIMYSWNLS